MSLIILGYKKCGFQLRNSLVPFSVFQSFSVSLSLWDHQVPCCEDTQAIYIEVHIVKLPSNYMGELRGWSSEACQELFDWTWKWVLQPSLQMRLQPHDRPQARGTQLTTPWFPTHKYCRKINICCFKPNKFGDNLLHSISISVISISIDN